MIWTFGLILIQKYFFYIYSTEAVMDWYNEGGGNNGDPEINTNNCALVNAVEFGK